MYHQDIYPAYKVFIKGSLCQQVLSNKFQFSLLQLHLASGEANMASQVEKLETDVHIKASAEQFHDVFCSRPHHIGNVSPDKIQGAEIHEGEWGTEGSIIFWNYVHGMCTMASKFCQETNKFLLDYMCFTFFFTPLSTTHSYIANIFEI